MKKVSIIMPIYNVEKYLDRSISSSSESDSERYRNYFNR